jgi:hypothetical protein
MRPATSISSPDVSLPEAGSLTPLCLGRDEDQNWRHLAWGNTLCGVTLLVAAAQLWPHAEVRNTRAGNTLASTPVELVLMPEAPTDTAKTAASIPPEQNSRTASEVTTPVVTTVVQPTLTQPIALTSVQPAVSLLGAATAAATTATSTAAPSTDAAPSAFNLVAGDRRTPQPRYPNPEVPVSINGDRDATHGNILRVLETTRSVGIERVQFGVAPGEGRKGRNE